MQQTTTGILLQCRNIESGHLAALVDLGRSAFFGLTVSPDERQVLYSRAEIVESDLMLAENLR